MHKSGIFTLLVFLVLLTASCTGFDITVIDAAPQPSGQAFGKTLDSPDAAVIAYLNGIAQGDLAMILGTCAIDEMGEGFRFDLTAERLQAMDLASSLLPSDYPFYAEVNKVQASTQILNQVKWLAYGLLSDEDVEGGLIYPADADRVSRFMADIDPERLSAIEIKQISLPDETLMKDARYLEMAASLAAAYGADEMTERVVLFSFEEADYLIGFTFLRYGDNWKIKDQTSPLGDVSANGIPQQISEEEFERLINSD